MSRRLELICQLRRRPAGPNQLDHLPPELRRIVWALLAHRGLPKRKLSGLHETGSTSEGAGRSRRG